MDFIRVTHKPSRRKDGPIELVPDFVVGRSKDLMVQGGAFYAVWNEELGLWSRDDYDVQILVDQKIREEMEKCAAEGIPCDPKFLQSYGTNGWNQFRKFMKNVSDNSHPLDSKVTFANSEVTKKDYVSRRLNYNIAPGDISAYETLVNLLYDPEEREKFEWAIGAVIEGAAKTIQKFLVFYGSGGTGKSTIMEIISRLMGGMVSDGGYVAFFDAQALTGNGSQFAVEAFKDNPLVAIQHDGDLSKIETNARLNSIVSHEDMQVNEKYKALYTTKINAFLFMGTNKPVQITDSKSGLIRRLIDVHPTGNTHEPEAYFALMKQIDFELGAIAHHCREVYRKRGRSYYSAYKPTEMIAKTDVFYNFVDDYHDMFKEQNGTTLSQAWTLYKEWVTESEIAYKMPKHRFREQLKDYFEEFLERGQMDGVQVRSIYQGFTGRQFRAAIPGDKPSAPKTYSLVLEETESLLDEMYAGLPAQYANKDGNPLKFWTNEERLVKGKPWTPPPSKVNSLVLGDLKTDKLHFLKVPEHHIVIDFDLKGDDGEKSLERNLEAAAEWPQTYAELSKSGKGVHLHYIYDGDSGELANEYSDGIEIKVYRGNASLRRRLTRCNNVSVATISSGLPFKEKKMLQANTLNNEQGLRRMIIKNLQKGVHPGTKPSIDFIEHLLKEAHAAGYQYDVSDMRPEIMAFANNSTNQAMACLKAVARMEFKSKDTEGEVPQETTPEVTDDRIVFFDCEVYPNLFVVCWKYHGEGTSVVKMINPTPMEMDQLRKKKLVGFNNRGYDNHIIYARMMGATNEELYALSQKIIVDKDDKAKFGSAWGLSYADVYDFSVKKQTLKKWEIELGIKHMEMDIPWDQPVPEDKILKVVEYCSNDVVALEAVFEACKADFQARKILAEMSGLPVNSSTRQHAIRIMFGSEREPQKKFKYTDLSEMFPGYKFDEYHKTEKSTYRGEVVGEGGYVYAEPGIHENVVLLDVASMHPTSIEQLELFGPYTETFSKIKGARLAIKHGEYDEASKMLPGVEVDEENAEALSNALKLVINSIYGYTSAKFMNPFRDPRNKDNIVAKRGALFMIDLKHAIQEQGFTVAHIKTDSVKIPNATPEIIEFVKDFGAKYGYEFEHEATYEKMCLVNDAVYVAKVGWTAKKGDVSYWSATGAEFQHPFVFKTLFTHEPISFRDLCETKQVKEGAMYLRFNGVEKEIGEPSDEILVNELGESDPGYGDTHVGRSGMFVPINPNQDMFQGGQLLRIKDGKEYAVTGTKGYLWAEAEMIRTLQSGAIDRLVFERLEDAVEGTGSIADVIDMAYYNQVAEEAYQSIAKFGDADEFIEQRPTA